MKQYPPGVVPADVLPWRDKPRSREKSAAAAAFKLPAVPFIEHLKAAGAVPLKSNPPFRATQAPADSIILRPLAY